jgi:RNA polymerase sigma factor (sigma-70 family)
LKQGQQGGRGSESGGGDAPRRDPTVMFTVNLDLINRAARHVARRHYLSHQDIEDFVSEIHLKLLENDGAVLRRFQGRSLLSTYLTSVIQRAFYDHQIKRWGRWRPSSTARRLGPLGMEMERLVYHEGRTLEESCAIIETVSGRIVDRDEAASVLARLPVRQRLREVGTDQLRDVPARSGDPEFGLFTDEDQDLARRAEKYLAEAFDLLTPEDRFLVRSSFGAGMTASAIARTNGLNQRRLYRRLERCMRTMREHLEARGISASALSRLLGNPAAGIRLSSLRDSDVETPPQGPSHSTRVGPVGADPKRGLS